MLALSLDDLAFDPAAQRIAEQRLPVIVQHLELWQSDNTNWRMFTTDVGIRQLLLEELRSCVQSGSIRWYERLYDLARDLGLESRIISILAVSCRARGWFDTPTKSGQPRRPALGDVLPNLTSIMATHETVEKRIQAFTEANLCRDAHTSRAVAQAFLQMRILERAASMIYALLERWHHAGLLGLLAHSDYLCFDELIAVQQFLQRNTEPLPSHLQAVLYADVVALKQGIYQNHPPLWHTNLLTEAHHTSARQAYRQRLFPHIWAAFVDSIMKARCCLQAEAEQLLNLYCNQGVAGILAWRSSQSHAIQIQYRLNSSLDEVCRGLSPEVRSEIKIHIEHVLAATESLKLSLSIHTLLLNPPSSPQRLALKRRLHATRKKATRGPVTEKQLAAAYGERAGLDLPTARFRLRVFLSYGVLGLLPMSLWGSVVHPQLFEWLKLIKLGYPAGAVRWSDIYAQAGAYSDEYNLPRYSSQLLHALYNSIAKHPHWHGGKGLAMLRVHQQFPKADTGRPRLCAGWLVRSCRLPVTVAPDTRGSYLTLVADGEVQLPVGLWVSSTLPSSREIGLALYQAIWHVGDIDFPIRGIPQSINIPAILAGDSRMDLQRAATYLLTRLDIDAFPSMRGMQRVVECLRTIQRWADEIAGEYAMPFIPPVRLMRELLVRLRQHSFPFHRQDLVPASIRQSGHALPGSSTPAAGWLLPVLGEATAHGGIINIQGDRYVTTDAVPSDVALMYRRLPVLFPADNEVNIAAPIFVEVPDISHSKLLCCPAIQ